MTNNELCNIAIPENHLIAYKRMIYTKQNDKYYIEILDTIYFPVGKLMIFNLIAKIVGCAFEEKTNSNRAIKFTFRYERILTFPKSINICERCESPYPPPAPGIG